MTAGFKAQMSLFPKSGVCEVIHGLPNLLGYKLCGAGGGGYLLVVSETKPENGIGIEIRRNDGEGC